MRRDRQGATGLAHGHHLQSGLTWLSQNRTFLRQPPLPAAKTASGVQNPCPKSTSHNHWCQTVVRTVLPMGHLLGYARVSTTDQQPQLQVDALAPPAATGCSPRPPAAPAPTDPPSSSSWTSCAPATPWSSGNSTASAAPCATWSTPSPAWPTAASGPQSPGGDRHHHPRRQARLPRVRGPGRVRTRPHPRTHQRRAGRCPGPGPPRRPAVGDDRPQAPGRPIDVPLGAVHGRGERQTLGVSRASIYRHLTHAGD